MAVVACEGEPSHESERIWARGFEEGVATERARASASCAKLELWSVSFEPRQRGGRQRRERYTALAAFAVEAVERVVAETGTRVPGCWYAEPVGFRTVSHGAVHGPKMPGVPTVVTASDEEAETFADRSKIAKSAL